VHGHLGFKKLVEDSKHVPEKMAQIGELFQPFASFNR
jgi:hypothetical protein